MSKSSQASVIYWPIRYLSIPTYYTDTPWVWTTTTTNYTTPVVEPEQDWIDSLSERVGVSREELEATLEELVQERYQLRFARKYTDHPMEEIR